MTVPIYWNPIADMLARLILVFTLYNSVICQFGIPMSSCDQLFLPPLPVMQPPLCDLAYTELAMPVGLASPFLPAASPVSALAPTLSPLLPAACPCNCRSHYLKKIPILPPCI
ncbi:uncharacterized protein LOC116413772 [Galleria mellonella]|uniref:Uncharacterized protein LOC116413772 n=1 Tax=Galleria mellonella TaxID=7137 RepID=A0A6J3CH04_GALME|nr:uncharacterized protein LOC116413772 [Galleria mellonella]